jgi:hypothetical protein
VRVSGKITAGWARFSARQSLLGLGALFCLASSTPSLAAEVSLAELQATLRSLGFLTSLQHRPVITLGVVYHGADAEAKMQAARVAASLARIPGPGGASVQATVLSTQELSQSTLHLDALYLMALPNDGARAASEFVRKQNVVSISSDPACLDEGVCVLLVQARPNMTIVLDTALAQAAGAKFSTVFTMMVKRR